MYNCSEACEGNVCARLCGNSSCLSSRRCAVTTRQAGSGCDVGALEFHLRTVLGHQSLGGVVGNHRPLLSFMTSDEFLYIKYGGRWCWCKFVLKVTLCILIQTSGFRSQWRLEWYYTVQNKRWVWNKSCLSWALFLLSGGAKDDIFSCIARRFSRCPVLIGPGSRGRNLTETTWWGNCWCANLRNRHYPA